MEDSGNAKVTRREFLIVGGTSAAAVTLPSVVTAQPSGDRPPVLAKASFEVNGKARLVA